MPRIDPIQLLSCLKVLLSPNGGIKSTEEVQRLANLMTKFSKKLVSKCIYIQILKCTETELMGLFMGSGGWRLVHMWLTESIVAKNWPLVRELLELLLLCPVDIERLKTNNCPKLVKELSKDGNHFAIRALASKLVEQWLKTVKGEQVIPFQITEILEIVTNAEIEFSSQLNVKAEVKVDPEMGDKKLIKSESKSIENIKLQNIKLENIKLEKTLESNSEIQDNDVKIKKEDQESEPLPVLKISVKDGKQMVSQIDEGETKSVEDSSDKSKVKHKSKSKEKHSDKNSSSKSSKPSSKSHSSSNEKHKSSHRSSSSSKHDSKDRDKKSSSSSKSKSDIDNKKSSDKSSSSHNKHKDGKSDKRGKEKSKEKHKDDKTDKVNEGSSKSNPKNEDKPQSASIHKLGKIPKLSDVKKDKPSISIEVRKPDEPKPKTVKTFHSKFRKHGLEEEVKPPPSRAALLNKKNPPVLPTAIPAPKRPSPVHNEPPPEKKQKTVEPIEKPGAIKLIPPKPKPVLLLESDMFMDALTASATNKKEPKKRKRRTSGSKDGNAPSENSPPHTPTTSPNEKSVRPGFYQDTLEAEESKEKSTEKSSDSSEKSDKNEEKFDKKEAIMDTSEPHTLTVNGLKGVLCYHKRKGPKKSIKWKPDSELEEIQFFDLDETERVNVTKTFTDMKYLERINEREAFQKARNTINDDVMEEKTNWRPLIRIDTEGQIQVEYGKNSKEKDIQALRQKGTLQPLYFHKAMIPDSALEPEPETHPYTEPTAIPLDDVTGNQDNVSDFRNMPWPEPKGNAPPSSSNTSVPTMFPSNLPQFPSGFPPGQFPGMPGFQPPGMVPAEWQNGMPPHVMANCMPGPIPPAALAPGGIPAGSMPPGMMMPPEGMMMSPEMFGAPNPMFPVPPEGFNMQQNMFPMDFNVGGQNGPDGFVPGNFRGPIRGGRGAGGHWRGKNAGNWDGPQRGRGGQSRGGRKVCMYFQRKGSCRQGDNCSFLHPGVNCPY